MEQHAAGIARRLEDSSDPEHLLAASFLIRFQNIAGSRRLLDRALQASPANAIILRNVLARCLKDSAAAGCGTSDIERRAMSVDGQNGTLLVVIAARRAMQGNIQGALDAMHRAATAPLFDSYYPEQLLAVVRALSAASDLQPAERLSVAFGVVPLPLEEAAFQMCRERIESSAEWRHACLGVAARMENDGDTLSVRLLGTAMQARIHRVDGDILLADAADQRREALRNTAVENAESLDELVFLKNPQLVNRYLDALTSYGEIEASALIKAEYMRIQETLVDTCSK